MIFHDASDLDCKRGTCIQATFNVLSIILKSIILSLPCFFSPMSDGAWSDVISLDSDFVALLSVTLLSLTFYPSLEAKCTLGVAVCWFSGVLLILPFKRKFRGRGGVWFTLACERRRISGCRLSLPKIRLCSQARLTQYRINLRSRANS